MAQATHWATQQVLIKSVNILDFRFLWITLPVTPITETYRLRLSEMLYPIVLLFFLEDIREGDRSRDGIWNYRLA